MAGVAAADPPLAPFLTSEAGVGYGFSSLFGPRMTSISGFDLHKAIDLANPPEQDDPVRALESGTVRQLDVIQQGPPSSATIFFARVNGAHLFRYLHLFPDSQIKALNADRFHDVDVTTVVAGQLVVVRLTRRTEDQRFAIVRFAPSSTMADYILHPGQGISNDPVTVGLPGGGKVLDSSGHLLSSTNLIAPSMVIGVVGDSGAPGHAHLHLDMGFTAGVRNEANPLAHIQHADGKLTGTYSVTLFVPSARPVDMSKTFARRGVWVVDAAIPNTQEIWLGVTYSQTGDLDRVELYVDDSSTPLNRITVYDFGGRTDAEDLSPNLTVLATNLGSGSAAPASGRGVGRGGAHAGEAKGDLPT